MAHNVLLEDTFSGPMDLMLHLVKRDELDIHDIPIAHLTREYLAEINKMEDIDVDMASEFMTVASMLMEIKSRMLLPPVEDEQTDEEEDFDPRAGLVQALLEYKRFKEAAAALGSLAESHSERIARLAPIFHFDDPEEDDGEEDEASSLDLLVAFQNMIRSMLKSEAQEIVSDEVPTEVRIEQIMTAIETAEYITFSKLLSSSPTKGEMVGFFIAILELVRLRRVIARQADNFSDIHLEPYAPGIFDQIFFEDNYHTIRPKIRRRDSRVNIFGKLFKGRASVAGRLVIAKVFGGPTGLEYGLTKSGAINRLLPVAVSGKAKVRKFHDGIIPARECSQSPAPCKPAVLGNAEIPASGVVSESVAARKFIRGSVPPLLGFRVSNPKIITTGKAVARFLPVVFGVMADKFSCAAFAGFLNFNCASKKVFKGSKKTGSGSAVSRDALAETPVSILIQKAEPVRAISGATVIDAACAGKSLSDRRRHGGVIPLFSKVVFGKVEALRATASVVGFPQTFAVCKKPAKTASRETGFMKVPSRRKNG